MFGAKVQGKPCESKMTQVIVYGNATQALRSLGFWQWKRDICPVNLIAPIFNKINCEKQSEDKSSCINIFFLIQSES